MAKRSTRNRVKTSVGKAASKKAAVKKKAAKKTSAGKAVAEKTKTKPTGAKKAAVKKTRLKKASAKKAAARKKAAKQDAARQKALQKRSRKQTVASPLETALSKRTKSELIHLLIELARDDRTIEREIELRFPVKMSADALIEATRQAIVDATAYDSRQANHNFDYDYAAYETVARNFTQLLDMGELDAVMILALELMRMGSEQVEMSDEGLMSEDLEDCLWVAIEAVANSSLADQEIIEWCDRLETLDAIGCHCDQELQQLKEECQ